MTDSDNPLVRAVKLKLLVEVCRQSSDMRARELPDSVLDAIARVIIPIIRDAERDAIMACLNWHGEAGAITRIAANAHRKERT
jgi:hypothetical protein